MFALSGSVARARHRRAGSRLGQFSIGPDAGLGVHAPEQSVIRRRHRRIVLHLDELSLPTQRRAKVFAFRIEAISVEIQHHAAPPELWPAALRTTRFTAAFASAILALLWLSGLADATAGCAGRLAGS